MCKWEKWGRSEGIPHLIIDTHNTSEYLKFPHAQNQNCVPQCVFIKVQFNRFNHEDDKSSWDCCCAGNMQLCTLWVMGNILDLNCTRFLEFDCSGNELVEAET